MIHKAVFAICVWLFVYPLVTGLLLLVRGSGTHIPLPLQTLLVTVVLVPVVVFGVVPFVKKAIGLGPSP